MWMGINKYYEGMSQALRNLHHSLNEHIGEAESFHGTNSIKLMESFEDNEIPLPQTSITPCI